MATGLLRLVSISFLGLLVTRATGTSVARNVPEVDHVEVADWTRSRPSSGGVRLSLALRGSGFAPSDEFALAGAEDGGGGCPEDGLRETRLRWANATYALVDVVLPAGEKEKTYRVCVKARYGTPNGDRTGVLSTLPNGVSDWIQVGEVFVKPDKYTPKNSYMKKYRAFQSKLRRSTRYWERRYDHAVHLFGLRVEKGGHSMKVGDDGVPELLQGETVVLRLFGTGFRNDTFFVLTHKKQDRGEHCDFPATEKQQLIGDSFSDGSALLEVVIPTVGETGTMFYLCFKRIPSKSNGTTAEHVIWTHLGSEPYLAMRSFKKMLPLYVSIIIIVFCLMFSALFSGLNLGLMSLDRTDLKIISNTGTKKEKKYAKAITPVRAHGNYLLCSILLGNVMVNSTFTILLDELTSGFVAVIASTLLIVIFGEITPQAICSRHGLAVGAKTIFITKCVMGLTCPLSYPISKILDRLLGEEIGAVYTRERLKELVKLTTEFNDLQKDEVNIISGALELSQKMVLDVMTKIEDVFMLSIDAVLDFETVSEIMKSGFSRVPVYEGSRGNIVSMLYIKDLALIDPDDNTPLKTHCEFYQNSCYFVFEDTTLDVLFKQFKDGIKGHMAFVHRVNSEGEGDPFYETVGLITLEDVIEELIQSEINDETDVYTDNKTKRRRKERHNKQDFSMFAEKNENQRIHISPQMTLATFQFLSTTVDAFKPDNISEAVLRRLLKQDVFYHIKIKDKTKKLEPHTIIYEQGKPVDYFVLILEGRVEVTVGRENLVFESGPFTFFGSQALIQNVGGVLPAESPSSGGNQPMGSLQSVNLDSKLRTTFVPDYGVRAVTEVFYMKIKRSMYLAAKRATLMEWSKKEESNAGDAFDDEMDKLIHTLGGDDTRSQGSPEVTRTYSQQSGKTSPQPFSNGPLNYSEPLLAARMEVARNLGDVQTVHTIDPSSTQDEISKLLPT
ncbi:metal transporter CNNM4-like isoform X2 [Cimex lectularius]|uniref:Metal transporter CNNM2 n=1 Tax=Cimex lectularius TaxID=79782 RepID=A0A8I6SLT7_CIMLE|nr:metal transporter CNNM4-like isoform X2 [Cimex lectularius]